jgi:predicted esterase YcpF (UPF0227 family)
MQLIFQGSAINLAAGISAKPAMRERQGLNRPRVVYLHGFNSSPASLKARIFVDYFHNVAGADVSVPELSFDPVLAMQTAESCITTSALPALIVGSSLGGYYATFLAQKYGVRAALINPAVSPCDRLRREFIGRQRNYYTGQEYDFTLAHAAALHNYDVQVITAPTLFLLLLQTGDEVLDYRLAVQRYAGCEQLVQPGGNHSFDRFEEVLPLIRRFAGL